MKIIHCADLHLDSKMESSLERKLANELRSEMLFAIKNMYDFADRNNVEVVIMAGDIFDTNKKSKKTVNYLIETFAHYGNIKTIILPGNHDTDNVFGDEVLPGNVVCFGNKLEDIDLNDVVIAGKVLYPNNAKILPLELKFDEKKFNILVLHGQESQYDNDKDITINIKAYKGKNIDYLALGHIHKHKIEKLDQRGVYAYSGCLFGRGFDETGEKGFVLLDTQTNSQEFIALSQIKFVTETVDISGINTLKKIELEIENAIKGIDANSLVKIVLHGTFSIDTQKDINVLKKIFQNKFKFLKIYDQTKLALNIDEYKNDISLKGEFIREVLNDSKLTQEEKELVIEYGMKALRGEEIL